MVSGRLVTTSTKSQQLVFAGKIFRQKGKGSMAVKCFKKVENQTSISTNTKPAECLRQCCQKEKVRSVRSICPSTKKGTKQAVPGKPYDKPNRSENGKCERLVLFQGEPAERGRQYVTRGKGIAVNATPNHCLGLSEVGVYFSLFTFRINMQKYSLFFFETLFLRNRVQ